MPEIPANTIVRLIDSILQDRKRAYAIGLYNEIPMSVEVSRFGADDARTYLVAIADSEEGRPTQTFMFNGAILDWWGEKPADGSRVFYTASPCALDFLARVLTSTREWHERELHPQLFDDDPRAEN